MHHVSVRVMEHAASLDLLAYEDPAFYDRLERARVQATDRLYMIQAMGRLIQQVITTITLSVSIMLFSPWLLLLLDRRCDSGLSSAKLTLRFWDTPRTFARLRSGVNSTTCAFWVAARKQPRN